MENTKEAKMDTKERKAMTKMTPAEAVKRMQGMVSSSAGTAMYSSDAEALAVLRGMAEENERFKAEVERLKKVEADFAQAIRESGHYRAQQARAEKAEAELERLKTIRPAESLLSPSLSVWEGVREWVGNLPEQAQLWNEKDDCVRAKVLTILDQYAAPEPSEGELILRHLLWLRHSSAHSSILYGDDGEMQCSACGIDFKRDSPTEIQERFTKIGTDKLAKAMSEGWHWDDKGRFLPPDTPAAPEPKKVSREWLDKFAVSVGGYAFMRGDPPAHVPEETIELLLEKGIAIEEEPKP